MQVPFWMAQMLVLIPAQNLHFIELLNEEAVLHISLKAVWHNWQKPGRETEGS